MSLQVIDLVLGCIIFLTQILVLMKSTSLEKDIKTLRRLQKKPQQPEVDVENDLTTRLEKLQAMRFSPLGNVTSINKRRETK